MARAKVVLVVDPDVGVRDLIADTLSMSEGFVVQCAADAEEGFRGARQVMPDLIVIDAAVAEGPAGRQLLAWVDRASRSIPVVRLVGGVPDPLVLPELAQVQGFDLTGFLDRVHQLLGVEVSESDTADGAANGADQGALDPGQGGGRTVLVVEDIPESREMLSVMLATAGYAVVTAEDGPSGLDAARRVDPDLVILDHQMPGLSGLDVLLTLRREGSRLPVIMLTAYGDLPGNDLPWTAWRSGVSLFMDKPFDMATLLRWVGELADHESSELPDVEGVDGVPVSPPGPGV